MDIKREIKDNVWQIMKEIYLLNEEKGRTDKQEELLERTAQYLEENFTIRRRKEKTVEPVKVVEKVKNPDSAKWGD